MFKEKTIRIFDVEAIRKGNFITYGFTDTGDNGTRELTSKRNGLVHEVTESSIVFVDFSGEKQTISLNQVLNDRVRILGVAKGVEDGVVIR